MISGGCDPGACPHSADADDLAVDQIDREGARLLGQAGHADDRAAQRDDEAGAGGQLEAAHGERVAVGRAGARRIAVTDITDLWLRYHVLDDPIVSDAEYDALRARTREYLRTAATVEITSTPTGTAGSTVSVPVRVTNLSGHKLPTGYEDARLMWLQVQVGGTVVSGAFVGDELVERGVEPIAQAVLGEHGEKDVVARARGVGASIEQAHQQRDRR